MIYLVVTVVILGLLTGTNVVLSSAVLRRLTSGAPAAAPASAAGEDLADFDPDSLVRSMRGRSVPSFTAVATDGTPVSDIDLTRRPVLFGFFSTTCPACLDDAPGFALHAAAAGRPRADVVAVIGGEFGIARDALVAALEPAATVITEPELGPIAEGFGVIGFPMYVRTAEPGIIEEAALSMQELTLR